MKVQLLHRGGKSGTTPDRKVIGHTICGKKVFWSYLEEPPDIYVTIDVNGHEEGFDEEYWRSQLDDTVKAAIALKMLTRFK